MPAKTDSIDIQNLLLEVLNVESSFGQEMRDKLTSVFDSVTEKLKNKLSKMEVSKDSISIDSIMGVDPASKEKTGKQIEAIQKRVLIQLREVAKAQNFKQLKGGVNITDIMTSNKVENSRIERQYNTIRNNLLKTVKASIPSKINLTEMFGISEELSKGKTPWSLPKDFFEKPEKANPYEPPPTYKEKEEKKEETEPQEGGFTKDIFKKLDKVIGPGDLAEEGKTKGREEFFEKEDKPQLFILDGISDNAMASLTKIMGGMKLGDISIGKMEEGGGLFGGIFGNLLGGLGIPSWIMKLGPILALVGGLIWLGIDAFAGWMKAEEWGVDKVSGMMGSLLGGTGSGLKNAFKNMGKWALIGAGIGSLVPGIGTIIGGLVGAAFGFIMGWIGGERISKAWQAVTDWVSEKMLEISEWFIKFWGASWGQKWQMIKDAFWGLIDWFGKVFDNLGELFMGIVNWIDEKMYALFGDKWTQLQDAVASVFVWIGEQAVAIGDWFAGIWKSFSGFVNNLIDGVAKVFGWIGEQATAVWNFFKSIGSGIGAAWDWFVNGLESVFGWIEDIISSCVQLVLDVKNWFRGQWRALRRKMGFEVPEEEADTLKTLEEYKARQEKERAEREEVARLVVKYGEKLATSILMEEVETYGNEAWARTIRFGLSEEEWKERVAKGLIADASKEIERLEKKQQLNTPTQMQDFIWRSGYGARTFSENDDVFGKKKGESMAVYDPAINENVISLNKTMNVIQENIANLLGINQEMLKRGAAGTRPQPLPPIPEHVTAAKALASDEATIYKTKIWEIIHGV